MATEPLEAALDVVLELTDMFSSDLDRYTKEQGVTPARLHLLWLLSVVQPARQTQLANHLGVSPRNVTGLVDALIGDDYAERKPDPADRRATLITLTAKGAEFVAELRDSRKELADQLFGDIDSDDVVEFTRIAMLIGAKFRSLLHEQATAVAAESAPTEQ